MNFQLNWLAILFAAIILFFSCTKEKTTVETNPPQDSTPSFYNGADLSFSPQMDEAGMIYHDSAQSGSALTILKAHGMNLVRLRLWYQPADVHSSLSEVMSYAKQIKSANEQFLLDFHYSDTWADPGKQYTPAAWSKLNLAQLEDSIYAYSKRVITDLKNQNTLPDIVQIGNEVNSGILWNTGKLNWSDDSSWAHFSSLLKQAIAGVKAADTSNHIKIMIHFAGYDGASTFFTHLQQQQVPFDFIGLSYYPFWHGSDLSLFKTALNGLSDAFQKKIMIVETAYPWTMQFNDYTSNIIGPGTPLTFPATGAGQYQFLDSLKKIIVSVDGNRGIGFCYWAPDEVAFNGPTSMNGSAWENMTLFDFKNTALPGIKVYGK